MFRKQFNNVLIAGNGAGKTELMLKVCISYLRANPTKRVLFLLPDDGEEKLFDVNEINLKQLTTFKGVAKLILDSHKDFEVICDTYTPTKNEKGERIVNRFNGLICADDLGVIMNRRPEKILKLFRRRRQPNIDFLWSFHGLRTEVPPSFYTYVNSIYLGRTSDNHEETKKQLPVHKQEEFETLYSQVQSITEKDPHYFGEIELNSLMI